MIKGENEGVESEEDVETIVDGPRTSLSPNPNIGP